ncbi:MAG: Trehalose transport system permease protein SugB [Pseudomonadota bacterium]|jgi:iron(III) transport system permease protein
MAVTTSPPDLPTKNALLRFAEWLTLSRFVLFICGLICAWLVFVPLLSLIYVSFAEDTPAGPGALTLENYINAYSKDYLPGLFYNSLYYSIFGSIFTLILGAGIAWVVERTDTPGRNLFHALALVSFAVPGLLMGMAWVLTLSPNIGWGNGVLKAVFGLEESPFNIFSMWGMIWVFAANSFPLAYLLMGPAFRVLDIRMEEAAVVSGARPFDVTRRVTMPLLRPAILSVLLLVFIRAIESFEVPLLLGYPARIYVFTTEIRFAIAEAPPQFGYSSALGLTLLAICVIGVYLFRIMTRHAEAYATVTGKGYTPTPIKLGAWRWPISIITALVYILTLGLPLFALIWQSFYYKTIPNVDLFGEFTLRNYNYILGYEVFINALKNSAILGALSATIVVILGFVMAWLVQRSKNKLAWAIDAMAFIPIAIPSVIIGASVLFAYLIIPIPVYNTIWILLIAYVTMFLPYGMRFASSGIIQIHKELEEVAEVSGASMLQMFRRVLLPLMSPALIAGWLYIFVMGVRELTASLFLAGPHTQVLGTISLTLWEEGGSLGTVAALAMVQIIPLIMIVAVMRHMENKISNRQ